MNNQGEESRIIALDTLSGAFREAGDIITSVNHAFRVRIILHRAIAANPQRQDITRAATAAFSALIQHRSSIVKTRNRLKKTMAMLEGDLPQLAAVISDDEIQSYLGALNAVLDAPLLDDLGDLPTAPPLIAAHAKQFAREWCDSMNRVSKSQRYLVPEGELLKASGLDRQVNKNLLVVSDMKKIREKLSRLRRGNAPTPLHAPQAFAAEKYMRPDDPDAADFRDTEDVSYFIDIDD